MVVPLVVILGAGASRGAGDFEPPMVVPRSMRGGVTPPLTVDLFKEELYSEVLRQYELAHQAGRYITDQLAQPDALGLEHALHGLAQSPYRHHRHMALAVPPYLQHLLHTVSDDRYTEAVHYDRLIEHLLRLPDVAFVSMNYDLLLDRRLNSHSPLSDLGAYINTGRNWSLIKPHGSVNWVYTVDSSYRPSSPPEDLKWDSDSILCFPPDASLDQIRGTQQAGPALTRIYPALAVPEGPDDRLVMPREHREYFYDVLHRSPQVDVLVLGYSGLDQAILKFFAHAYQRVRHMTVVSENTATAHTVLQRFIETGINPLWWKLADGNFANWSNGGGLRALVEEYGGPYPSSSVSELPDPGLPETTALT